MYRISNEVTGEDVALVEFSFDIMGALPVAWGKGEELMKAFYAGRIEQWSFYDGAPNELYIRGYVVEWIS